MKLFDNGWYHIIGGQGGRHTHYFFNDKPLHVLNFGQFPIDCSKRYANECNKCKFCINILKAYSKIGLQNRCE